MPRSQFLSLSHTCAHKHTLSVPLIVSLSLSISLFLYLTLSVCFSVSHFLYVSVSPSRWSSLSLRFSLCLSETEKNDLSLSLSLSITDVLHSLSLSVMSYYIINFCLTSCLSVSLCYVSPTLSISLCFCLTASVRVSRSLLPSLLLSLHQFFCLYPSLSLSPFLTLPRSLCYVIYHITNFSVSVSLSVCPCLSYSLAINFCLTFSGCLSLSLALSRTPSSNYGAFADENSE